MNGSRSSSPAKVILVTGVTSGIGLALARALWSTNYKVVASGRKESLQRLAAEPFSENERFLIRPLDLNRLDQQTQLLAEIKQRWGGVDVLVNNAGISYRGVLEHINAAELMHQMSVNYYAPMQLTRAVTPHMRAKRAGHIINISSVGGMMAMPTMGAYSASKFALEGASEALWYEMKPWNVKVSLIQPGFVRSSSYQRVLWSEEAKRSHESEDDYTVYYRCMESFIAKFMQKASATPEDVARIVLSAIEDPNPALRIPISLDGHLFSLIRRYLPRRLYHWILYRNLPCIKAWGKE